MQLVEYENLPTICFDCGWYGYFFDDYSFKQKDPSATIVKALSVPMTISIGANVDFGLWMIASLKNRRSNGKSNTNGKANKSNNITMDRSRFEILGDLDVHDMHSSTNISLRTQKQTPPIRKEV